MKRRQIFRAQASKSQTGSSVRRFANSGPVLPFNPASIPGCQLWLDAADSSSVPLNSSSNVLAWIDKSGNENHMNTLTPTAAWSGSAAYPTIGTSINGLQTVNFVAQSGLKQATTLDGVKNLFWVGRIAAPIGTPAGGAPIYFLLGHDSLYDWHGDFYGSKFVTTGAAQSGITSATASLFTSDTNAVTNTTFGNVNMPSAPNVSLLSVSGITGSTRYQGICYDRNGGHTGWCGDLAEVLIFNSVLTTIQRQKVEGYLAHKWGLQSTLPSNHPHKTAAPTYEEPVFVPTLISGSQLWLDAMDTSSLTLSGSSVTSWTDKSGNGLTVSAASSQPTYATNALNGLGTVAFNGGQGLSAGTVTGTKLIGNTNSCAIYAVVRFENTSGRSIPYSWDDQTYEARFLLQYSEGNNIALLKRGATATTIPLINSLYYIVSYWQNGLNTQLNVNGTTIASLSNFSNNDISSFSRVFNVGYYANDPGGWNMRGNIAEILFFNTHIPSNFKRVEGYLAQKWGLHSSLPANHPYKTIAPTGIPRSITSQSLSVLFNSGSLSVPANAALTLGTNNHTFEFWLYQTSRNFYDVPFIYGNTTANATNNYAMLLGQYTGVFIGNGAGGLSLNMGSGISLPALNTWSHYALVRNGNTFTLYLNGTNVASATLSISIPAQGGVMAIGGLNSGGNTINGYMANFRFVNGTAVYTSNFTPPTSPLTAIPNTQVLIQGFVDRSPNAFTVTSTGGVTLSTSVSPFV